MTFSGKRQLMAVTMVTPSAAASAGEIPPLHLSAAADGDGERGWRCEAAGADASK